jgi:hypothetical protein
MQSDLSTDRDRKRTRVGPDPLDYALRYAAGDYDCYYQGRYIGSRATLAKAIEVVEYEQAKAARHRQAAPANHIPIASYQDELRAIAARLHNLANRIARHPAEPASMRAHLMMAHIRVTQAIKNVQEAERSCALAERAPSPAVRLDAAS